MGYVLVFHHQVYLHLHFSLISHTFAGYLYPGFFVRYLSALYLLFLSSQNSDVTFRCVAVKKCVVDTQCCRVLEGSFFNAAHLPLTAEKSDNFGVIFMSCCLYRLGRRSPGGR